eukprot:7353126-Prymnesium_polylepis.1
MLQAPYDSSPLRMPSRSQTELSSSGTDASTTPAHRPRSPRPRHPSRVRRAPERRGKRAARASLCGELESRGIHGHTLLTPTTTTSPKH